VVSGLAAKNRGFSYKNGHNYSWDLNDKFTGIHQILVGYLLEYYIMGYICIYRYPTIAGIQFGV
jgi:hypothetical protein